MNSLKQSSKRLVVESVRDNLRRITETLIQANCDRASCKTSWQKQREFGSDKTTGLAWNESYEKQRDQAEAGHDRRVQELEAELGLWEDALSHALDALEVRA